MTKIDCLFIGSGINSLVGAALLAKTGKKVLVLERSQTLGGCIQTKEVQGCKIDTLSTAYPLFVTSPAFALLKDDLSKYGVEFISNDVPTGSICDNGHFAIIKTNRQENIQQFNTLSQNDGQAYDQAMNWVAQHAQFLFTMLGQEIQTTQTAKFVAKYIWKNGVSQTLQNIGSFLPSVRSELPHLFKSDALLATMAPWVLHTGLSPESPFSATMAKIVAFTVELVGLPLIKGGSHNIVQALQKIIEVHGGQCQTNTHVNQIILQNKKAVGVKTHTQDIYAKNIIANVTPTQLYSNLIPHDSVPQHIKTQTNQFNYGKGNMQIHLILNQAPNWINKNFEKVVYTHLTNGIDAVSRAVNEAQRQVLPAFPTICIAQPTTIDPSRSTDGKHVLWIQLPECPNFPQADAANELSHICKGQWTEELKNAYCDRILNTIQKQIPNIKDAIVYKEIISPKDLENLNINLVNGDPYSGQCEINQYLLWRPQTSKNHQTPIPNLYHIGASTHPGPGLGAGSGFLVYNQLKK